MDEVKGTPMYIAVSLFLAFTSMFFAAIIEAGQRRLRLIFHAYLAAAIITGVLLMIYSFALYFVYGWLTTRLIFRYAQKSQ